MSGIARHRSRSVTTPEQMFRAVVVGAAFALILAWTLQEAPVGATPAPAAQVLASR